MTEPIFIPTREMIDSSNLSRFIDWLKQERGIELKQYDDLWQWSVRDIDEFWTCIIQFFKINIDVRATPVRTGNQMISTKWFEHAQINYAEYLIRNADPEKIALIACNESNDPKEIKWKQIVHSASKLQSFLIASGLKPGDRVAAYLPNIKEASIALLACIASGFVWSVCSPDFGEASVIDRFKQIAPKAFIATGGYHYGGKYFDRRDTVTGIIKAIPSIQSLILVDTELEIEANMNAISWEVMVHAAGPAQLQCITLPFNHPMWILYSSGTTGLPKAITHCHGGMLLEHIKYVHLHNDVKPGERFFWFTTTGWMMWNYLHATWLAGATILLYDGNPMYPDMTRLWSLAEFLHVNHFGTGAPFIHAGMKENIHLPALTNLRSISSTGSPLNAEAYNWLYRSIPHPFYIWSMSGGTDVCSAFVGGCALRPVYTGEIQCRALGCDLDVFDESGHSIHDTEGELVIKQSMPCMPIYFWNDVAGNKYRESYFDHFPGVWRHGDWITLTVHDGLIISGRSDTTLKRFGVRIGTAEIYAALLSIPAIEDALIIHIEYPSGDSFMPLFVKFKPGYLLDENLISHIKNQIKSHCSPRHVPDRIIQVADIPYTLSGKKMEATVKKLFLGKLIGEVTAAGVMRNPECLKEYEERSKEDRHFED